MTNLDDYRENAKFKFAWQIMRILFFAITFLTIFVFFTDPLFFYPYLIGDFLAGVSLWYMHRTKEYKVAMMIFLILVSITLIYTTFYQKDYLHFQEGMWMVVIILTAFYLLGNLWGSIFLTVNASIYIYYLNIFLDNTLPFEMTRESLTIMSIEFIVSMFLIGYIMVQYQRLNSHAFEISHQMIENIAIEKDKVDSQNREKTVLLQEIHHRIKNNLQVIVSLLRIQSNDIESEQAKRKFSEAIDRILTMSLIHQKMYSRKSLSTIDLKDYLKALILDMIKAYAPNEGINLNIKTEIQYCDPTRLVPLGLIVNELTSNTLKHAFRDSASEKNISVSIHRINSTNFLLNYSDNGKWIEREKHQSFGIQLLDIFSEQLDGSYTREIKTDGTFYTFSLKNIDVN